MHNFGDVVKNNKPRKSGLPTFPGPCFLCKSAVYIHRNQALWISPVEKSVESVENSTLSTGISALWDFLPSCGKKCIPLCIIPDFFRNVPCYVTGFLSAFSGGIRQKSWKAVKSRCQTPAGIGSEPKKIVKNRQSFSGYHLSIPGNTFPINPLGG